MNNVKKHIKIYKDKVIPNFEGFEFSWDYIGKGGKKSETYLRFEDAVYVNGTDKIRRIYEPHERKNSGLVVARLALQVFEDEIDSLTDEERKSIVTDGTGNTIGIWTDESELKKEWGNSENSGKVPAVKYVADKYLGNAFPSGTNPKYYFYNAGLFDSIHLVKSMLSRFGSKNSYIEVTVSQKEDHEDPFFEKFSDGLIEVTNQSERFLENLKRKLSLSKNIILRGAPGTGKSFMAKQVASLMVSNGRTDIIGELDKDELEQIEFVQFHPSYDYTDFVEGLRPVNTNGQMSFELFNGVFKDFCTKAKLNQNINLKTEELTIDGFSEFLRGLGGNEEKNYMPYILQLLGKKEYRGNKVEQFPTYNSIEELILNIDEIKSIDREYGFRQWLITPMNYLQRYYDLATKKEKRTDKKYIFIIDEINRGEISKIFGELFYSIDPGYRGSAGAVLTQYSNMRADVEEKFYVPENVYILGTMNDIDRSVDSFDFAMRRRFRFIKIGVQDSLEMLSAALGSDDEPLLSEAQIEESIRRINSLNQVISSNEIPELNDDYHIGPSYFLKLHELGGDFDLLWSDFIQPLLEEYLRGSYETNRLIEILKSAYNLESEYTDI